MNGKEFMFLVAAVIVALVAWNFLSPVLFKK